MRYHLHLTTSMRHKSCGSQWKRQQLYGAEGGKMVAYTQRKISLTSSPQNRRNSNEIGKGKKKRRGKANNMSGRSHYTGKWLGWNWTCWNAPIVRLFSDHIKNFIFQLLKREICVLHSSGGHNFVTGRYCYWQKLGKSYEIKCLFACKFMGTKNRLHLNIHFYLCAYICICAKLLDHLSPQNFHGVTFDSAIRLFLKNIIKITWLWRSAPIPLKVIACWFQVEQL